MGELVAPRWVQTLAWTVAVIIAALNVYLLYFGVRLLSGTFSA